MGVRGSGLLCALFALSACSSGAAGAAPVKLMTPSGVSETQMSSPTPSDPPTYAASPTQSSSARQSPVSSAAISGQHIHSAAGAERYARAYVQRLNVAWTRPDPTLLEGLATGTCQTCQNYVDAAQSLLTDRRRYDGDPFTVKEALLMPESTNERNVTQLLTVQEPRSIVSASGAQVRRVNRDVALLEFAMSWSSGRWSVLTIKLVRPS